MAKNDNTALPYVDVDQLRIGLYVHIDLPWFKHPFTLNSFKISSEGQLRDLRELGEARFRYDPARSDALPAQVQASEPAVTADAVADPAAAPSHPASRAAPAGRLTAYRQRIEEVDKAFLKAGAILRQLNRNLMQNPHETLQEMGKLVEQMVQAFLEHPEVALHVMGEKCGGDEAYVHSLNVSVLCMMLTKGLDFNPEQARALGLGALLHDIGLLEIPDRVLKKKPSEYTRPERELRALHCEYGLKLGRQLGLAPEVLAIIYQHHEMADGSGYPQGLELAQIIPGARVVALVNYYDNLCNPIDMSQAMTPHEALSFMFAQRRSKFDPAMLQQLIRCLGVYPPGTLVSLSNDAIALVMSVNPAKPLRPCVMVYDESVPKEEAPILDLEHETELHITKAIRPAMLPPRTAAYLSPRQHVTYFFDSNSAAGRE